MSRVMKLPAALKILAATSGWPSRPIFDRSDDDDRGYDDDEKYLPVIDIGDEVSRFKKSWRWWVRFHSWDPH